MKQIFHTGIFILSALIFTHCGKSSSPSPQPTPTPTPSSFTMKSWSVDGWTYDIASRTPEVKLNFSTAIDKSSVASNISFKQNSGTLVPYDVVYSNADNTLAIKPTAALAPLTRYRITVSKGLKSASGGNLNAATEITFMTTIDSSDKFSQISDSALIELVQKQTFKYFWDFGHPVSGLARERNTSGDIVTSGGSGFGIMAILTGIHRGFITRTQGLERLQTMVSFLKNTAKKVHGAFPHWLNGATGAIVPFSPKDDGADLVETSYLMQGLLCARQYFNGSETNETALRADINTLWNGVDWSWFRRNNENTLYWHYSENYTWDMNMPIRGWNECLITYVLAASSPTHSIPKIVYDEGWAQNGGMKNGQSYYGYVLPLGPEKGGPLFFSHYSFLGINPNNLTDAYADYHTQVVNHTKINYEYCKSNPNGYYGYSDQCWGLTASDIQNGYTASSPTNDVGVIAPTAALSSFPYTPTESMKALRFFYYKLGDKLWGPYGFYDAFSLKDAWFANSYLAIDQGPIIVMIENYRTGLLWNLFTSCPEVKSGMKNLGFAAPYL